MQTSVRCVEMLVDEEGCELKAYLDTGGQWTIGIGHLITGMELRTGFIWIGDAFVDWKKGLTRKQAYELKIEDMKLAEASIRKVLPGIDVGAPKLTQNQYDALVSFVFNIGLGQFRDSTMARLLKAGKVGEVAGQFRRWNKDAGKVVQGLVNRRESELMMWEGRWMSRKARPRVGRVGKD